VTYIFGTALDFNLDKSEYAHNKEPEQTEGTDMTREARETAIKNILKATEAFVKENEGKVPAEAISAAILANMNTIASLKAE